MSALFIENPWVDLGNYLLHTQIFPGNNISYLLIHTRTHVYQGVRNVSFPEKLIYILNR